MKKEGFFARLKRKFSRDKNNAPNTEVADAQVAESQDDAQQATPIAPQVEASTPSQNDGNQAPKKKVGFFAGLKKMFSRDKANETNSEVADAQTDDEPQSAPEASQDEETAPSQDTTQPNEEEDAGFEEGQEKMFSRDQNNEPNTEAADAQVANELQAVPEPSQDEATTPPQETMQPDEEENAGFEDGQEKINSRDKADAPNGEIADSQGDDEPQMDPEKPQEEKVVLSQDSAQPDPQNTELTDHECEHTENDVSSQKKKSLKELYESMLDSDEVKALDAASEEQQRVN